jgi:hypothetical protein
MADNANGGVDSGRVVTLEFGDECCRQITINTLKMRVRGKFSLRTLASRPVGARDVGRVMNNMPDVPGLRIKLYFRDRRYVIYDPLEKDKTALARINAAASGAMLTAGADYEPVGESKGQLDENQWKTLILELARKNDGTDSSKSCWEVEGKMPTTAQAEQLKGRRLNDPWNGGRKPRYHDEVEEWAESLDHRA